MKKRTKPKGSGRKKGPETIVKRIPKSIWPQVQTLISNISPKEKRQ